ncbi:TIR-like protein FxsC [Actinoplanes sp. NBC_00393]|uniref:TIR-like protein FxsC n=1 Tax=Actinoplanes sp. NBC_00393 TaxID=2975953 RepID=UPI002E236361
MGSSVTPPLFFISYVHDSGEDDRHVRRFYEKLNHDVLIFAGRRQSESAGFCDCSIRLGQLWSPALIENLSTAQVFIPIMSPAYFQSEACGKEWALFVSRLSRTDRSGSPDSSIIPLLWVPMTVPGIAEPYQFKEATFGAEYDRVKLRALIRGKRHRDEYDAFVQLLAERVVTLSQVAPVAAARDRPGFDDVRSAFSAPPAPRLNGGAGDSTAREQRVKSLRVDRPILNTNLREDPR